MIKLFIAEDHTLVIQGYQKLLAQNEEVRIVATSGTYFDIIHKLKIFLPDVLLLDLSMPMVHKNGKMSLSGLDILEYIKNEKIPLKILIASTFQDYEIIRKALTLGASGYVFKNIDYHELVVAIQAVAGGKSYIQKEVEAILQEKRKDDSLQVTNGIKITNREKQIMLALSQGEKAQDIADALKLNRYTVEEYKKNLLKKFNAKNATHLIKIASDMNMI